MAACLENTVDVFLMDIISALRVALEMYDELSRHKFQHGKIAYNPLARIVTMHASALEHTKASYQQQQVQRRVVVATAGTTDIPVAEEAAVTLEAAGIPIDRVYDAGVAGLHRIIRALPKLTHPAVGCVIVAAGMDGALPSVVGGLVSVPVIAVPTSIGYGASFGGVSAMLTMMNSCSPGVGVVNIDNGFGAAALAFKCIRSGAAREV
jgi:pyridinium-3,5-biscarboxylic acid mononucleotide synthase